MKNLRSEIEKKIGKDVLYEGLLVCGDSVEEADADYKKILDALETLFKERTNAIIGEDDRLGITDFSELSTFGRNQLRREQRELLKDE